MSSAINSVTKEAGRFLEDYTVLGSLMGGDDDTDTTDYEAEAQQDAQDDATNAARTSAATAKKKSTTSSVLTSPLGTSSTASTAVTKLGGM